MLNGTSRAEDRWVGSAVKPSDSNDAVAKIRMIREAGLDPDVHDACVVMAAYGAAFVFATDGSSVTVSARDDMGVDVLSRRGFVRVGSHTYTWTRRQETRAFDAVRPRSVVATTPSCACADRRRLLALVREASRDTGPEPKPTRSLRPSDVARPHIHIADGVVRDAMANPVLVQAMRGVEWSQVDGTGCLASGVADIRVLGAVSEKLRKLGVAHDVVGGGT